MHLSSSLPNTAIVEYIGVHPGSHPHGNGKHSAPYIRTHPSILNHIDEATKNKRPKAVYDKMILDNTVTETPRDMKQVRNVKYNGHRKEKQLEPYKVVSGNIADQIQHLSSSIHSSNFVQHVILSRAKVPAVILHSEEQILDISRFCCPTVGESTPLRVGKTFNLTELHLTTTVYKNLAVTRKTKGKHPVFFGPMFLHGNSDFETFATFFDHLATKLASLPNQAVIDSDDEKAMRKAIKHAFPRSTTITCERHLRNNVVDYLRDNLGINAKDRARLTKPIFDTDGIAQVNDNVLLETKTEEAVALSTDIAPGFTEYLRNRCIPMLQENIAARRQGWTNNNCESLNHVLKQVVDWKTRPITDLIKSREDLVRAQYKEVESSFIGRGSYVLCAEYREFSMTEERWTKKSKEQRERYMARFFQQAKRGSTNTVTSTDGKFDCTGCLNGWKEAPPNEACTC